MHNSCSQKKYKCQWLMDKEHNIRQSAQFLLSKSTNVKIDRCVVICSFGSVILPRQYQHIYKVSIIIITDSYFIDC